MQDMASKGLQTKLFSDSGNAGTHRERRRDSTPSIPSTPEPKPERTKEEEIKDKPADSGSDNEISWI